ncbi:MAG: phosphosulfolactate synthase [Bacteroidales bacterium]
MTQFTLPFIPERPAKPRQSGIAMVMDKGLSVREAEDFVESAGHLADFVKLGFGTSVVGNKVKEKVKVYHNAGIKVYAGGTLFEAFVIRNQFDEYLRYIDQLGLDSVEVSDGSMLMDHEVKCEYIHNLSKNYTVLSEVGSKESGIIITPARWIEMMQKELQAGAFKVIGEARESGNVGIYRSTGKADVTLIKKIQAKIPAENLLWEAPIKAQQVWFIKNFGANVNLGNIAPSELIPLETLRLGLRGDTFFSFLPAKFRKLQPK